MSIDLRSRSATRGAPPRHAAPVFVVGAPRSGTTLLYHMLLSAGGFVRFRSETHFFNVLAPRFGHLRTAADRRAAADVWIASGCHALSGLDADEVRQGLVEQCDGAGQALEWIMAAMARRQGVTRWAETTPAHLLHMPEIKAEIPSALFVHVVRDGRDVTASLVRQHWIRPLPFDRRRPALASAAFWDWMVPRGHAAGAALPHDYLEVRYEALVERPVETLATIGDFIEHRLDWEEIQRVGIGSVRTPNTSFPGRAAGFTQRWRSELSPDDARDVDSLLASSLRTMGYESDSPPRPTMRARAATYRAQFALRDSLKRRTTLGRRLVSLSHYAPGAMSVTAEKLAGVFGTSGDGESSPAPVR